MSRLLSAVFAIFLCGSANDTRAAAETAPPLVMLEHVTVFVRDYDEALSWYIERLGLVKVDDQRFGPNQRWLTVATSKDSATHIVLAVPSDVMKTSIGHQHNWVFRTEDCHTAHTVLANRGVQFVSDPQELPWGCQAVIEDLYGNHIVLRSSRTTER